MPKGGTASPRVVLLLRALHDIYHAGQVQLLKRLQGTSRKTTEPTWP